MTHSKIGGLFMFQEAQNKISPIHLSKPTLADTDWLKLIQYSDSRLRCTTHYKIGGLFMFQEVQNQMSPIYVYLPFQTVKLCTHINSQWILFVF